MRLTEQFRWGERTFVMGVLNITPDSFSGDGLICKAETVKRAIELASQFISAGADILDIGGESTRPGSRPISIDEEISRVVPVVTAVSSLPGAVISIDSYKAEVVSAALDAGAQIVNDVWALQADAGMPSMVALKGAPVILMHNRSRVDNLQLNSRLGNSYLGSVYNNLMVDICEELKELADAANDAGISNEQIILDPGIGFGKTVDQNLTIINKLDMIKELGYPVLLGASRKSFIGRVLNAPVEERFEGTAAACVIGISRGADIIRVHDVKEMVQIVRIADAILRPTRSNGATVG